MGEGGKNFEKPRDLMEPKENGLSPAQELMGRTLRSNVLGQNEINGFLGNDVGVKDRLLKEKQVVRYNQHAKDLSALKHDDVVRLRTGEKKVWNEKAVVHAQVTPRSYKIQTEEGSILRRNRRALLKVRETFEDRRELEVENEIPQVYPEVFNGQAQDVQREVVVTREDHNRPKAIVAQKSTFNRLGVLQEAGVSSRGRHVVPKKVIDV